MAEPSAAGDLRQDAHAVERRKVTEIEQEVENGAKRTSQSAVYLGS
jgi:hypothetical protein